MIPEISNRRLILKAYYDEFMDKAGGIEEYLFKLYEGLGGIAEKE